MIKVEMTGRLFKVAEALTAAGIPFNIKKTDTVWVLEIKPPIGCTPWTLGENQLYNYVSVRDEKFDNLITTIEDDCDPVLRLAEVAAFEIEHRKTVMSFEEYNKAWSNNPIWLQVFLKYGIVKAQVVTTYNYVNGMDRQPLEGVTEIKKTS